MEHWITLCVCFIAMVLQGVISEDVKTNVIATTATCGDNTYMIDGKCTPCTVCGDLEFTATSCNASHDTVCECQPGYYKDIKDGQCKTCRKCPVGWGASPACTSTSNTVCVACPPHSYSSIESSTKSCQSCTICDPSDEFELQQCTAQQDTSCFRIQKKSTVTGPLTEPLCTGTDCTVIRDNSYLYTVPLYCTALGAIILGLLIYVVLRCRWNKKRAAQMISGYQIKHAHQYHMVQQQQAYSTLQLQTSHPNSTNNTPASTTSPHIVYLLNQNGSTVTSTTRYKDLPSNMRRTIVRSLAYDGSWLKLAHNLGFTPSEVSQIQQKAQQDYKGISAASILITEWTKREFSSVGVMLHALASINRHDLVILIRNMNKVSCSPEVV